MKKIILIPIMILVMVLFLYFFFEFSRACGQMASWGKSYKTGQCRYFPNTCLKIGYSPVDIIECDCDNLDPYSIGGAMENCKLNQEYAKKYNLRK